MLFHDWIGTFFALIYTMAGFFLMLYLLLPTATAQIPRAATSQRRPLKASAHSSEWSNVTLFAAGRREIRARERRSSP